MHAIEAIRKGKAFLISPCCGDMQIADLKVTIVKSGEEGEEPTFGLSSRCCQDLFGSEEELLANYGPNWLRQEQISIIQASKRRAQEEAEARYIGELEEIAEAYHALEIFETAEPVPTKHTNIII